ncbi:MULTISPECIES: hypothetical protein [Aphanizomenon]|uniref:hypothetical protein n=1 Tax=Aphanizomenon TaxID=1175 RepID=UPI00068F8DDE|nr:MULTISPECIES: hypothetical protein [Aphanizomenon]
MKDLTWGYSEAENDPDVELKAFTAVLNGDSDASKAFQNSSCAVKNGSNLTCTVDIFKVFKARE